jgi:protease inhibitor Inh
VRLFPAFFAALAMTASASAQQFEALKPMDMNFPGIDPSVYADLFGPWELRDSTGKRRCRIVLKKEYMIGGQQIEVAPDCAQKFPIMNEIVAWRLLENWTIDLVDPLRKTRIRFSTPDDRYVASPESYGIDGLFKPLRR